MFPYRDDNPTILTPYITVALIAANAVVWLLVQGLGPTDIADRLHLSVKTVSTHKTRILGKMGMESTADLVRYAVENKLS